MKNLLKGEFSSKIEFEFKLAEFTDEFGKPRTRNIKKDKTISFYFSPTHNRYKIKLTQTLGNFETFKFEVEIQQQNISREVIEEELGLNKN